MNIFKLIINYFKNQKKIKLFKTELLNLKKKLKIFKEITISDLVSSTSLLIQSKPKYLKTYNEYQTLLLQIESHNKKVNELSNSFTDIINNNKITDILENIDNYSFEVIKAFNATAIEINNYTIPDDFIYQKAYIKYIIDIGKIFDNYIMIKEQHSLINNYQSLVNNIEDKYIDAEDAKPIFEELDNIISSIEDYKEFFYETSIINKNIIDDHNLNFINNHRNDEIFNDVNGKSLDFEQRSAILCDSLSNLTIAGAGSGKTLTICGKVKWLLEQGINPEDILLLSYSSASAMDLKEKVSTISQELKVKTFHSLGLEILTKVKKHKLTIEDQLKSYIKRYFDEELKNKTDALNAIFNFFTLYSFDKIEEEQYEDEGKRYEALKQAKLKTLKDRLNENFKTKETFKKELVKSKEELIIANWLLINGIKYEYEKTYEYPTATIDRRQYTPDFYLTDYGIYLEHYGIDKEGHTPQYSKEEEIEYLNGIEWKRQIHQKNNTICLETYSYEFNDGTIFNNLKERLTTAGVELKVMTLEEVYNIVNDVVSEKDYTSFLNLLVTFINLYKSRYSNNQGFLDFRNYHYENGYEEKRTKEFLIICEDIYNYYISNIRKQDKIDFDDMILQSIQELDNTNEFKYKYIIVDEFQDISLSRFKFLKKLISHGHAKLFAVGDDWQAIYRFAGCDINIFLKFHELFEDAKINKITSTHRNSIELQWIVEPFITANPEQFVKHISSNLHQENPVRIIYHDNDRMNAFNQAINQIYKIDNNAEILVLGRNRHDVDCLLNKEEIKENITEIKCDKYPTLKITYKTVHQSKGLESNYVILISGDEATNGFPNKMEDDVLLKLVLDKKGEYPYAEERRLFYVALTRTKSIVYILSNIDRPSSFVQEIENLSTIVNPEILKKENGVEILCPWCKSGKLTLRKSSINGGSFFGCSNYPYCEYTIDDVQAVITNNQCPVCGDFLVMRNGKYGKFIGCHNYPRCKYTKDI